LSDKVIKKIALKINFYYFNPQLWYNISGMEKRRIFMKGFRNVNAYVEGKGVIKTSIIIEKGKIVSFEDNQNTELMQLDDNLIVIPGLIDEHIHGANNSDAMDGSVAALENIARTLAKEGVTSFLATTMTQSPENITSALKAVREYKELNLREGASLLGAHLEGPFISKQFIGAQPLEYVAEPSVEVFRNYQAASGNNIRIVTLAPDKEPSH
jgi:N-acetylglucosamine-6-phosphate deacetylase